jgi:hypothetical protein
LSLSDIEGILDQAQLQCQFKFVVRVLRYLVR